MKAKAVTAAVVLLIGLMAYASRHSSAAQRPPADGVETHRLLARSAIHHVDGITFFGPFVCKTSTCDGHVAGYVWASERLVNAGMTVRACLAGNSEAFVQGCTYAMGAEQAGDDD